MSVPFNVCFPYWGGPFGGSHMSSLSLIRELESSCADTFRPIIVLHSEGEFAEYLQDRGIPYELLPLKKYVGQSLGLGQLPLIWQTFFPIRQFIKEREIDIVHGNEDDVNYTWAVSTRFSRAKHVWHMRALHKASRLGFLMDLCSIVVCVSRFVADSIPSCGQAKSEVLVDPVSFPEGISRASSRQALLRELGASEDTLLVCFVGNFLEGKRPDIFVKAAARMVELQSGRILLFLLFGDDREGRQDWIRAMAAELGIEDKVRFMGFRFDIDSCIKACDLALTPAVNEGLGRLVIEPMVLGVPVVAANSGGIREIVRNGETGVLVTPDNPEAFATAGARLLDDAPYREKIVKAAQVESRDRFSSGKHVDRITEIYGELLGKIQCH